MEDILDSPFHSKTKKRKLLIEHLNLKNWRHCDDFSHPVAWSLVGKTKHNQIISLATMANAVREPSMTLQTSNKTGQSQRSGEVLLRRAS